MGKLQSVQLSDGIMRYGVFGCGKKAFVILPGMALGSVAEQVETVEKAYSAFCGEYTCYLFDRKAALPEGTTVRDMAEDTACAMKQLGIGNAHVYGASQGGMLGMYLAAEHPELVEKLCVCSTAAGIGQGREEMMRWAALSRDRDGKTLTEAFCRRVYTRNTAEAVLAAMGNSVSAYTDEDYRQFRHMAEACLMLDMEDVLKDIHCPMLAVGARQDRILGWEATAKIAAATGCQSYIYEGYAHGVYDEAPDFPKRMLDFFRA